MESRTRGSSGKVIPQSSSSACVTCRVRRKRCDRTLPTCEACKRNILICVYTESPVPGEAVTQRPLGIPKTLSSIAIFMKDPTLQIHEPSQDHENHPHLHHQLTFQKLQPSRMPMQLLPLKRRESRFLYDHYLHRTALMLSATRKELNPFVNVLLPIATWSDLVLQSVLALSGMHFGEEKSTDHMVATYEHYAQALRSLKYGLTKFVSGQTELALELFTTTLIFCFMECIRGDQDGISFRHLNAARHLFPTIIRDTEHSTSDPQTVSFLVEYYAYILAVSSFSLSVDPNCSLLQDVQPVFVAISALKTPMSGMLLGCAHELFALIPSAAAEWEKYHYKSPLVVQGLKNDLSSKHELRMRVLAWSPGPSSAKDWVIAGQLYQLAILLLLEEGETPFSSCDADSGSDAFVSRFVALLRSLGFNSEITTTLCWPIAVVGSHACQHENRQAIRQYVSDMEVKYGFRNIAQLKTLLDVLWEGNKSTAVDAESIIMAMKKQAMTVMLV